MKYEPSRSMLTATDVNKAGLLRAYRFFEAEIRKGTDVFTRDELEGYMERARRALIAQRGNTKSPSQEGKTQDMWLTLN